MITVQTKTFNILSVRVLEELTKELFPKLTYRSHTTNGWYNGMYEIYRYQDEIDEQDEIDQQEQDEAFAEAFKQESGDLQIPAETLVNYFVQKGKLPDGEYLIDARW